MPKAMNFTGFLTDSDFWSALVQLRNGMKGINDKQLCDLTGYLVVLPMPMLYEEFGREKT